MEKKEITILDLVKIAANWMGVLIIGAVACALIAFFYSTKMVTPMYSASSKYVIQTKGQADNSDVIDDQRVVAYAQLALGTYIDIVDTRNFAEELALYMNGNFRENTYSPEVIEEQVNTYIKHGMILDGGIIEGGNLDEIIDKLADAGLIDQSNKTLPVADVVESLIMNADVAAALTDEQIAERVQKALRDESWIPDYVSGSDILYPGDSAEKIAALSAIGLEEGKPFGGNEYTADMIKKMISFGSAEESTTFTVKITSQNANEAYTIAKLCEIVMADYIEKLYPGTGVVTVIDSAVKNPNPINNNTVLLTLVGFAAGLVLAFVVVYIIELADNRIKNEDELAEKTGLSVVGIIPDTQYEKSNTGTYGKRIQ